MLCNKASIALRQKRNCKSKSNTSLNLRKPETTLNVAAQQWNYARASVEVDAAHKAHSFFASGALAVASFADLEVEVGRVGDAFAVS